MQNATHHQLDMRPTRRLAMTGALRQAIDFLKLDNLALAQRLKALAEANPALGLRSLPPQPDNTPPPRAAAPVAGAGGTALTELRLAAPDASLRDHVATEIAIAFRTPEDLRIASLFAEALEPTGWLGEPLATLARRAGCATDHAERILMRLQQIEPAGIFARDLAECLRLQASERGLLTDAMATVLQHLDLIARGKIDTLAELCNTDAGQIMGLIGQIRSFNPKPGLVFAPVDTPIRPPDAIIHDAGPNGWRVELNDATTPEIKLRTPPSGTAKDDAYDAALAEARWILRAVSRRNATVLRVVGAVVTLQSEFLRAGVSGLRPLTRVQVAEQAGLHETTIGRVATAMLVQTPQGTLPLRSLFGPALKATTDADGIAASAVRHRLREIIASEDPAAPLNDAALADILAAEGIQVARRTIAKYRDIIGAGSSRQRRSRYKLTRGTNR
ncbi:RNA polymerase factor sigma-54 [Roseinatronobacter sp. NSM]|uniref:RNA polymerase factor sigma-54 n=1 Tax=Roseinatronobacter sp. NSM TaxID=3457785 RepID=UPI0040353485